MKNYLVHYGKKGKVFETLEEANAYRDFIFKKTRLIVCVSETNRKVTHVFNL